MNKFIVTIIWCLALVDALEAQPARFQIKPSEEQEALMVISNINRPSLAFRAAVIPRMLEEANYFSDRLKLPTPHPIQMTDIQYPYVSPPWFSVVTAPIKGSVLDIVILTVRFCLPSAGDTREDPHNPATPFAIVPRSILRSSPSPHPLPPAVAGPVIVLDRSRPTVKLMRWGLIPTIVCGGLTNGATGRR
jgi:hypothetical protein